MKRWLIVAVLAAAAIAQSQKITAGQSAACAPSGGLSFICGVQNPEDLVLVPNTRWMIASGMAPGSATNHGGRQSIEVFELDTRGTAPSATWVGCVLMPNGMEANSVAAFTDGTLMATVLIMPGKSFEDAFAGRTTGAVFMWTPGSTAFRMLPGTEMSANNGIRDFA